MYDSLQRLAALPADTVVFPGHRYSAPASASMEAVLRQNYVFRPSSREQWLTMFGGVAHSGRRGHRADTPATVSSVSTRRRKRRASRWRRRAMPVRAPIASAGQGHRDGHQHLSIELPRCREHDHADDVEHGEDGRDRAAEASLVEVPGLQHEHERRAVDTGGHRQRTRQHTAADIEARAGVAQVESTGDDHDGDEHGDTDDRAEQPVARHAGTRAARSAGRRRRRRASVLPRRGRCRGDHSTPGSCSSASPA